VVFAERKFFVQQNIIYVESGVVAGGHMAKGKAKAGQRRITFTIEVLGANHVSLMGDFNEWDEKVHPMKQYENDIWKKTVFLDPGRYEYKFLVDGQWHIDPNNYNLCPNRFGTNNNFLIVS